MRRRRAWRARGAVAVLVAAALQYPALAHRSQDHDPVPLGPLLAAYEAGDRAVVQERLTTREAFTTDVSALERVVESWGTAWSPARAAFLMEVAVAARKVGSLRALAAALSVGATYVTRRSPPLGADRGPGAFEVAWHRTAVALLEDARMWPELSSYVSAIDRRYRSAGTADPHDGRLALAGALVLANRCCSQMALWRHADEAKSRSIASATSTASGTDLSGWLSAPNYDASVDDAIRAFGGLRNRPDVGAEAGVRGAWLLLQRGQTDRALSWLVDLTVDPADRDLQYWSHIIRARVLDGLGRFALAAAEYRAAQAVVPDASAAALGLGLDLLRTGHADEAADVAETATRRPAAGPDPWWSFDAGDARFLTARVAALRNWPGSARSAR